MLGSIPDSLLVTLRDMEKTFTVDTSKLKEVTEHFVKELEKGLFVITPFSKLLYGEDRIGLSIIHLMTRTQRGWWEYCQ